MREIIRDSQLRETGAMHKMLGQAYQMKEEFETARQHFMVSLEIDAADLDLLLWTAWNGVSRGDSVEATHFLRRFLQQAPEEDPRRAFATRKLRSLVAEPAPEIDVSGRAVVYSITHARIRSAKKDLDSFGSVF